MDYKFIITILILTIQMVIIHRELKNIKKIIRLCLDDIDTSVDNMTNKINNDMNICVDNYFSEIYIKTRDIVLVK